MAMPSSEEESVAEALAVGAAAVLAEVLADIRDVLDRTARNADQESVSAEPCGLLVQPLRATVRRAEEAVAELTAFAGRQSLAPAALVPLPFLCSFADLLRHTLDRRIDISVEVSRDCPPYLADPDGLQAAMLELVTNARDAMSQRGSIQMRAEAAEVPGIGAAVALSVVDSGAGMAPEIARRAARPFYSTKRAERAAGMGLAAVEGFVRQSGGRMVLRSRPGAGTSVVLYLPRARETRLE